MVVQVQVQAQVNVQAVREVGCAFGCCRSMEERLTLHGHLVGTRRDTKKSKVRLVVCGKSWGCARMNTPDGRRVHI